MRFPRTLAALLFVLGAASSAAGEKPSPASDGLWEGEGENIIYPSTPLNPFFDEPNVSRVVANLTGTVASLAVHVPVLHNASSQLERDAGKVQAQVERMRGLDKKIKQVENQARKDFHAKIKALAEEFYTSLDERTKSQRDTLSGLKQALKRRASNLERNAARASGVRQRVRRLKQMQNHGMERIENHMAEKNLVVLVVGNITFTYRNPSNSSPNEAKQPRRLEAVWTESNTPVTITERRLLTHRGGAQSLADLRVDSSLANSFIHTGRRTTRSGSTVQRRFLWGSVGNAIGEAASSVCESCLETAERGVEATKETGREAAALAERGVEATAELGREAAELTREGVETTRETVEVPREVLAAAAAEAERLANEAIDYARGAASGAFDALSKAAAGLVGAAKEAYDWLGKLENVSA